MIALLQRVAQSRVVVAGETVGAIERGLLVFLCAERDDGESQADTLLNKVLGYRVFGDETGKMNRSVRDISGGLLVVPQFPLAADTQAGTRPSFTPAAAPADGKRLFDYFVAQARSRHGMVASGIFAADMQVHLVNDGPVTFWLQVPARRDANQLQIQ